MTLALGLAAGVPSDGLGAARLSCRSSGRTVFARHGVRAFFVTRYYRVAEGRAAYEDTYVCSPTLRRPRLIDHGQPYVVTRRYGLRIVGRRLGFVFHIEGFANGSETDVGWIDLRTATVRVGLINAGEGGDPGQPQIPDGAVGYAIAPDGSIAVIGGGGGTGSGQQVGLLAQRGPRLAKARVVYRALHGGLVYRSISIDRSAITWRTTSGQRQSVPR
ncbi:MAG: hypothetical protein E6G56_05200 [Actinobacteria bacterium]|nr:MAG: hypothetical protein E6G56_05200 [Actinomycetota bacterium]